MAEHPNAEVVRRGYEAFGTGDMEALSQVIAEDAVWHTAGSSPIAGDHKGHEAIFGHFADLVQRSDGSLRVEVHDIVAGDEHAVALVRVTGEKDGQRMDVNEVHVMHIRDGKVAEWWDFHRDQDAVDAFFS